MRHEQARWWRKNHGYTSHISRAGRFTAAQAFDICSGAMIGTASRLGALPELPVRLADVMPMVDWYLEKFPNREPEDWQ